MDICDFCDSPDVVERFQCRDFDSSSKTAGVLYPDPHFANMRTDVILASHDFWAACSECAKLVEAHDINGLVKRVMDEDERKKGRPHPMRYGLEQHLWRTYALFFRNRV
jgi:hypothetical protein